MNEEIEVDKYGNPTDGSEFNYCSFPDCGCDGARLCMAKNGPSEDAYSMNVEGMWSNGSDPKCAKAVFKLVGKLSNESDKC